MLTTHRRMRLLVLPDFTITGFQLLNNFELFFR
jgi:hypothetical protein